MVRVLWYHFRDNSRLCLRKLQQTQHINFITLFPEGKTMAVRYDSKYIEVSAVLNHKVDELLVGILRQIRLKRHDSRAARKRNKCADENGCVPVSSILLLSIKCQSSTENVMNCLWNPIWKTQFEERMNISLQVIHLCNLFKREINMKRNLILLS